MRRLVVAMGDVAAALEIWGEWQRSFERKDKKHNLTVEQCNYWRELMLAKDWYFEHGPGLGVYGQSEDTALVIDEDEEEA